MKRILSLVFLSMIASGASAEDLYTGRTEVGGALGGMVVDSGAKYDTTHVASGGRVGYYLTNDVALEAGVFTTDADVKNDGRDAVLIVPTVEGQYHFGEGEFRPFLSAGIGAVTADGPPGNNNSEFAMLPIGGGVKWLLTDNLTLRFDGRWIVNTEGGAEEHQGLLTGGISWLFDGDTESKPAEPAREVKSSGGVFPDAARALERDKQASIQLLVEFDFDKSDIRPEYHDHLMQVAQFMKEHPNATAEIEGHTDNVGTAKYNLALSGRRAASVRNYLESKGGIAGARLTSKGYGFSKPKASNATAEGRQQNRRVVATFRVK